MNLFKRMIEAITDFDSEEQPIYDWAKQKHDATNKTRKHSGDPYWVHPEGVAKIAKQYGGSPIEVEAALAHDTMEDTGATFDELCQQFGEEVAMIVAEVTNNQTLIDKWGKEQYMNFELTSLSDEALFVKLCDNYYNIVDYPKDTQKKRIINNIKYLIRHKKLNSRCKELCTQILDNSI